MRAAIYARFSTDQQSVASIDDQARICSERAKALGLTVVGVHSDCAVSGATPVDRRPGARACVAEGLAGRFSVLLVESLDRLSRNLVEQETVIRRLEHRGIRIVPGCASSMKSCGRAFGIAWHRHVALVAAAVAVASQRRCWAASCAAATAAVPS